MTRNLLLLIAVLLTATTLTGCLFDDDDPAVITALPTQSGGVGAQVANNVVGQAKCTVTFTPAAGTAITVATPTLGGKFGCVLVSGTVYKIEVDTDDNGTFDYTINNFTMVAGADPIVFMDFPAAISAVTPVQIAAVPDRTKSDTQGGIVSIAVIANNADIAVPLATMVATNTSVALAAPVAIDLSGQGGAVAVTPLTTVTTAVIGSAYNAAVTSGVVTDKTAPAVSYSTYKHTTAGDIDNDRQFSKGDKFEVQIGLTATEATVRVRTTVTGDIYRVIADKTFTSTSLITVATTDMTTTANATIAFFQKSGTKWVSTTTPTLVGTAGEFNWVGTFSYNIEIFDVAGNVNTLTGTMTVQP